MSNDIAPLRDKSEVVLETYAGPDSQGRHKFTVYWWDEGYHLGPTRRGQVFNANLEEYAGKWRAQGRPVRITQEAGKHESNALGTRRRRRGA